MCSYAGNTGGLELYCVDSIDNGFANGKHSDMRLLANDPRRGMAVSASAPPTTFAHELGHACGLGDLYDFSPGDGLVSEDKVQPLNWSGGEGTGYYAPALTYSDLTYRAIMNAPYATIPRADLPLDRLTWRIGSYRIAISVGLSQMTTRDPRH